jgi:hypothetical protein
MPNPRPRIVPVIFGFIVGAAIGLKTVVPLVLVLGIRPSLDPGFRLAIASAWILCFALAFAFVGARASNLRESGHR